MSKEPIRFKVVVTQHIERTLLIDADNHQEAVKIAKIHETGDESEKIVDRLYSDTTIITASQLTKALHQGGRLDTGKPDADNILIVPNTHPPVVRTLNGAALGGVGQAPHPGMAMGVGMGASAGTVVHRETTSTTTSSVPAPDCARSNHP